jgi:hypothetical protein
VNNFLHDHQEKRKLLVRWAHYFPHEPNKDFDVSRLIIIFSFTNLYIFILNILYKY